METLIAALISGGLALVGTVISVNASQRKTEIAMRTELAVMNNKIETLTKRLKNITTLRYASQRWKLKR